MPINPIETLKTNVGRTPLTIRAWVANNQEKETANHKPYRLLVIESQTPPFREALKIWPNYNATTIASQLAEGTAIDLHGNFMYGDYGLESDSSLEIQMLPKEESATWFKTQMGNPIAENDLLEARLMIHEITDPLLQAVGNIFLEKHSETFLRSGGARFFHHARRGGLVEHSIRMMKTGRALAPLYKANADLVVLGALVHDAGKMMENLYSPNTPEMPFHAEGEMLSHIPNGMLIIDECLREARERVNPTPIRYDSVRLHLLHLVASHHGTLEFGSPVTPRTPEALILHCVDNLDAKMEFFNEAYNKSREVTQGAVVLHEKHFPFPGTIAKPLTAHTSSL